MDEQKPNHLEIVTGPTTFDTTIRLNGQELRGVVEVSMRLKRTELVVAILSIETEVTFDGRALVLASGNTILEAQAKLPHRPGPVEVPGHIIAEKNVWFSLTDDFTPPRGRNNPLVWRGPSGYTEPQNTMEISGYYDPEYRPRNPFLTWAGDAVSDHTGHNPTHWRPRG